MKKLVFLVLTGLITACSGGGSSGGGGGGTINKFTAVGTPITADAMVSAYSVSSVNLAVPLSTSQAYYGRALMKDGADIYAMAFHFTLNKNDANTAYFSNFFIDYLTQVTGYTTSSNVITTPAQVTLTSMAYNILTNSVQIADASKRFVNFSIDFSDNTHLDDISNAAVIFTTDFNTMVGGDDTTFFFIAQKASSLPASTIADLFGTTNLVNFYIDNSGTIAIDSTSSVVVGGSGGTVGMTAFTGQNSISGAFQGEVVLNNSNTGAFVFGYDDDTGNPPTVATPLIGAFLFSPDKKGVLGYDTISGLYFAASK